MPVPFSPSILHDTYTIILPSIYTTQCRDARCWLGPSHPDTNKCTVCGDDDTRPCTPRDSARSALLTQHVSVAQFFGPLPPVGVRREGGENAHDSHTGSKNDTMDDLLDEVGVDLDAMLGIEPDEPEPKPPPGVRVDPRRHKVVCKHWLRGLCKKGDEGRR